MISPLALEISVVCLGLLLLMRDAFSDTRKRFIGWVAIVGLLIVFAATFFLHLAPIKDVPNSFYVVDSWAIFFKRFMLLATALTVFLGMEYAPTYLRYVPSSRPEAGLGEFLSLPVFTCAGLMWMVSASDFIMIFVALELVTISFYVLVATMRKNVLSLEAGVKYLILGALSTGFLVYGITWIFGVTGQTSLVPISAALQSLPATSYGPALFGFALILIALGFKVAAVPFQFWVPDVYQGAPTPITAFLSVASKAAGIAVLVRVVMIFLAVEPLREKVFGICFILAAVTLILGNLAALPQSNLKRLLAYSSIAHAGYLLIAVASFTSALAAKAIGFYLAGYLLMTFLAFYVLITVQKTTGGEELSDFNGLGRRSPLLALALLVAMSALAGLPLTVGFMGKFLILEAAYVAGQYALLVLGVIVVPCGFYYYLKVVRSMYWQPAPANAAVIEVSTPGKVLIALLCIAIIVFGIYPQPILNML